jgi:hypothetical protein
MLDAQFRTPDPEAMRRLTEGLPTKSAKIRALAAAGYRRADIASFLGIRYQHVRNVLLHPTREKEGAAAGPFEQRTSGRGRMEEDGHVALPADALSILEARPGGAIPWRAGESGEVILMSPEAGLRRAQAIARKYAAAHPGSWADELIADRRAEAARESEQP